MFLPCGAVNGFVAKTYVATGSRYAARATVSLPYWTVPPPPPTVQSVKASSTVPVLPSV
jgi:hypothetical protein